MGVDFTKRFHAKRSRERGRCRQVWHARLLFATGNGKGGEYRAELIIGRFRIGKFAAKHEGAFFARIWMDGTVTALEPKLEAVSVGVAGEAERV